MAGFILTQGALYFRLIKSSKAMQMKGHIWKITFSICLLRENTRQDNVCIKCLCKKMFVTKVSARTDSKMATQTNVYFFKQSKAKQNPI